MNKVLCILISILLFAGCSSIQKNIETGEDMNGIEDNDVAERENELVASGIYPTKNITLKDVLDIEDWHEYYDILGKSHEILGLDSNITTEIYNLSDGGVLKIIISYPEGGKIYPYLVYGDTLIVLFDNKNYTKSIMEEEDCIKCIYFDNITDNVKVG